jgi:hypothetical protein
MALGGVIIHTLELSPKHSSSLLFRFKKKKKKEKRKQNDGVYANTKSLCQNKNLQRDASVS